MPTPVLFNQLKVDDWVRDCTGKVWKLAVSVALRGPSGSHNIWLSTDNHMAVVEGERFELVSTSEMAWYWLTNELVDHSI